MSLPHLCLVTILFFASNDNNVEWNGVSHIAWQDRRPLCPMNGESFDVLFQAYRLDINAARVHVDDGTEQWVNASFDHDRGPYAVWRATIPATASSALSYYVELTDGTDTDYYSISGMSDGPPADGGFVLNFNTLEHAPVGATPTSDGGTVFKVWAPTRTSAYVRGEFNGWGTGNPMTKVGEYFIAQVPAANAREQYKYYFNPGAIWKPDARGRALNPSDNYNTHIEDPFGYTWNDDGWQTPSFGELVICELHVGTYAGRNDPTASGAIPALYDDVAAHAADLAELGINAVELMPITEFSWDFSAGYNPVSQWAPEWKYGTPDDLKAMIDTLHQHGIAVILDLVWNHFGYNDNFMWQYDGTQIYFDDPAVDTPWGSQADFDNPTVRAYYLDSALYWFEEFHIDGVRMDATHYIKMYQSGGWTLLQELNDLVDNRWVDKIIIAEQLPDDAWVTRPTSLGGAGFDSQWHDAFVDNLRQEIFDAAFGDPEMWRIQNIINGSGLYLEKTQVVNYLELHDEAWPDSGGQRLVRSIDSTAPHDDVWAKGRTKLGEGLALTAPGIPTFLMGTEWLEDENFGSGSPSGANRIDWSHKTAYAGIFDYYADLNRVRRWNPGLHAGSGHQVFHVNEVGNVVAFQRYDLAGNVLVVVASFSNSDQYGYRLGFPQSGTWYELINSQAPGYEGDGPTNGGPRNTEAVAYDGFGQSALIDLPAMGLLVFRYSTPPEEYLDADDDAFVDAVDNCPDNYNPGQADGNGDGIGDACDCNNNGVIDSEDIALGTSEDLNGNGIPDECEGAAVDGDMNCDGSVNNADIPAFVLALTDPGAWGSMFPGCNLLNGDIDDDGSFNNADIPAFVDLLTN